MELNLKFDTYIAKAANYGSKRNLGRIKYIVVHFTANNGDTAIGNGKYFARNVTGTSAHYFIDENMVLQSVYDNYVAYHCGGVKYYHPYCRNSNSIGVELCSVKKDGEYYFKKEVEENAISFIAYLMDKYNIEIENVLRHYDITHKNCPAPFIDNKKWNNFKEKILYKLSGEDDEMVETGNIKINGKDIKIDKIVKEGHTFINLRELENADFKVDYNPDTKLLILNNKLNNLPVSVNGNIKEVSAINVEGNNY
ncbi:MAG: N-acetylmuramoyl-L-alanine amidase family protein, partial [Lachnospirales bacterium]